MYVNIAHDTGGKRRITFLTQTQGREPQLVDRLEWSGFGIDNQFLKTCQAIASSVIADRLIWRYGVRDELDTKWAGEAEPF